MFRYALDGSLVLFDAARFGAVSMTRIFQTRSGYYTLIAIVLCNSKLVS